MLADAHDHRLAVLAAGLLQHAPVQVPHHKGLIHLVLDLPPVSYTHLATALGYTFVDVDEYIWRQDTEIPFSIMYPRAEKIGRLMEAISACDNFVMAGSMDSFHEYFDPFFTLVVHLHTDAQVRLKRVHNRELDLFGARILEGGDMYAEHQKFLNEIARYD